MQYVNNLPMCRMTYKTVGRLGDDELTVTEVKVGVGSLLSVSSIRIIAKCMHMCVNERVALFLVHVHNVSVNLEHEFHLEAKEGY